MSHAELDEHRRYLADDRRVAAYRAALAEVVGPDDVVLDLGSGTGLLGYLACEVGARSVVSVDRGDIVELARRIAADNGYDDRITHVQGLSTGLALDRPADVAVCDQIGGLVHDAGVLGCFADARDRLLAPGATLVPAAFRIFLAPVRFPVAREAIDFWASRPSGIDISAAHEMAINSEWKYRVGDAEDVSPLGPGGEVAAFAADQDGPIAGSVEVEVDRPGRLDGHLGWFEAQMSPSVILTNDPWSPDRFDRWCNFYAVPEPVDLVEGDRVRVDLDVRPRLGVVTWSTRCTRDGHRLTTSRSSTFEGSFLAADSITGAELDRPVPRTPRAEAVATVVGLVDGSRTQGELVQMLEPLVGSTFVSRNSLVQFVRDLSALVRG